jgi:DNA polymerase epsilon subunit 3
MSGEAETLPLAHVKRVVKAKLAEVTAGSGAAPGGEAKKEVTVQKDALAALAEAGRIFIHYLTGTANELCQEGKRQTINADDVLRALDEVEFSEFSQPLREALAGACCCLLSGGGRDSSPATREQASQGLTRSRSFVLAVSPGMPSQCSRLPTRRRRPARPARSARRAQRGNLALSQLTTHCLGRATWTTCPPASSGMMTLRRHSADIREH